MSLIVLGELVADHFAMGLQRKMALWVIAAAFIAQLIAAPTTYFVIDRMLLGLKANQLRSEVSDVSNSISNLMGVGLPLPALRRTQHLLEQARSRDPQIASLLVFDPAGQILYSTDLGEVGATIPPEWREITGGNTFQDAAELVATVPLTNSFGNPAGGVALRYALSNHAALREELWLVIAGVGAMAMAMTAALADRLSRWILKSLHDGLEALIGDMEAVVAGQPAHPMPEATPVWLMRRYVPFAHRVRLVLAALDSHSRELAKMDEAG